MWYEATIKSVLAWQFQQAMEKQQKTKQAFAKELRTSRSQVDRLLDPMNTAVSLKTISRAADALGFRLVFEIRTKRSMPKSSSRKTISARKVG